jgi:ABC-2 type transport system permease protein
MLDLDQRSAPATIRNPQSAIRNFWADLWLLLRLRWTVSWNTFRSRKWWQQALQGLGILWLVGWLGFVSGLVGFGVGRLLRRFPDSGLEALLPGLILTAVALIVLISSFGVALGSLFLASDLETLMTAPVSRRAVFTSKILDGLATYYGIVLCTAIPALVTYGLGLRYGPAYYLLAIIATLGTPLLPAGLGALLTLAVARFAPVRRVREVLGLVGAIIGISCSLIGQSANLWLRRLGPATEDPEAIVERLRRLAAVPLPSFVAGRGLAVAGEGRWLLALGETLGFLLLTFGSFALCVLAAERLYATGWARLQGAGVASRNRARAAREATEAGWLGRAPAWAAIALKDWRVIPRDLRNFAQLLSPLLLLPIVYLNILGGAGRGRDFDDVLTRIGRGDIDPAGPLIAFGVLTTTALVFRRVASNSISAEGRAWWIMKIAPVAGRELLRGKLAVALVPFAALSTALLLGAAIWRGFSPVGFLYGWLGVQLLGAIILATAVAASVPWARLDWDDPRKMISGWGALFSFLIGSALAGLAGLLLTLPLLAAAFAPALVAVAWVAGPLLAAALALATVHYSLEIGARFLARVGEG